MPPLLVTALAAGVAIPVFGMLLLYRRDLHAARARLAAVDRHVISTRWGAVEYAERGTGDPVLVVHGIFHNCVGGARAGRLAASAPQTALTVPAYGRRNA